MKVLSIIIPIYKGIGHYPRIYEMIKENLLLIEEKALSVELILVNDYPEETLNYNFVENNLEVISINHIKNRGIHQTRVDGYLASKGDYILFLDQDDSIKPSYIKSQIDVLNNRKCDAVVCAGWNGKNKLIYNDLTAQIKRLNCIGEYETNPIISPGQVVIVRNAVPKQWLTNIVQNNGADDWFLWILMHKTNKVILPNEDILFYHNIDRTKDSIDIIKMTKSVVEMKNIISKMGILTKEEEEKMSKMVNFREKRNEDRCCGGVDLLTYFRDFAIASSQGNTPAKILKENGIKRIAIYGTGTMSVFFERVFANQGIEIVFGIDQKAISYDGGLKIFRPSEDIPREIDAILITIAADPTQIEEMLKEKVDVPILTAKSLLYMMESK